MATAVRTKLTLPANTRLPQLVQDYTRSLAELAGFPADQGESLAQAVWEACDDCLEHAFDDDDEDGATISLVGELTPSALTLSVRDRGLPFRQVLESGEPQPESAGDAPQACWRGRGLSLAQHAADEVRWICRGPEGNELRLMKYRLGVCLLPTPLETVKHRPELPGNDAANYVIRPLLPRDAIGVAQLMYRVYGYSYTNEDFYYPERLNHDLETEAHVGVVAVTERGEIVGHAGVVRPDLGPLAELGQLAVAPAHRGHNLNKRMGDLLHEEIRRLGLVGLFGEAVTLHTISQEASERRGLRVSGIKLLDWRAHFKKFQETESPRESMVFYFKYLTPPGPARVCAPSRHREMLATIYENLQAPVEFLPPSGPTGHGQVAVHFDRDTGVGTIRVNRVGIDTLPDICQARRDLCDLAGAAVVGLDLPLAQGSTPYLSDAVEAEGFFFSGVRPHFAADGDFLRLQYLNAEFDPERLHLYAPFARELLDYILREKARVGPGSLD